MRELERRFPGELAIIGVHSGKYIAERDPARIADAARRLGVHHAVLNDRQFRVWRSYAVRAWPTLVAIDPEGRVVGMHAGEFEADAVAPFVERLLADARARGVLRAARHDAGEPADAPLPDDDHRLRYPGKLAVADDRVAIADTGNARVLVGRLDPDGRTMTVERVVHGAPAIPFVHPQGVAFDPEAGGGARLYVADAGTHTIHVVDLASGEARVLAGTGRQLRTTADLAAGALSSPWDVVVVGRTLHIAMAGIHQLWTLDLASPGARARAHAGSRAEDIVDGALATAALAQPMGLAAHADRLWFADSESSAIRWADLSPEGAVGTVVGTGLFDFGDVDGAGDAVRLQHPQGVAASADGRLLVADSYNDALKWVDPATRTSTTFVRGLHEPGGLALAPDGTAWVADTNAHRIVRVTPAGVVEEVRIL